MAKITKEAALLYHSQGKPGKIEVVPTKPYSTQTDLSLAYSPGVAEPCLEIEKNPQDAYKYTAKGNLVAVISNGTAVLGLGLVHGFRYPCHSVFPFNIMATRHRSTLRSLHDFFYFPHHRTFPCHAFI